MKPPHDVLFSSDLWLQALDRYASDTHLSVKLFDAGERIVFGPVHSTPLFQLFEERGYDPGIFSKCARWCLHQTDTRPAVMVSEVYGLAVIGTSLVLEGEIVGAAVAGYAFVDFSASPASVKTVILEVRRSSVARTRAPRPSNGNQGPL